MLVVTIFVYGLERNQDKDFVTQKGYKSYALLLRITYLILRNFSIHGNMC